jgi:triacylglycerol lipase
MRTILLAHGVLGFSKIGQLSYFNGVPQCWGADSDGHPRFLTPGVDPAGSIKSRALELKAAIEGAFSTDELNRGKVVHIVAHSLGGLDARYLISKDGLDCAKWVRSLTTLSTPHRGSPLADIVTGKRSLSLAEVVELVGALNRETLASILHSLGKAPVAGIPLEAFAPKAMFDALRDAAHFAQTFFGTRPEAFTELTTDFASAFSERHKDLQGVPFLCFAGSSGPALTMCRLMYGPSLILKSVAGDNDGAVPVSSSKFGDNVRTIPADHFEEVGLAGLFDGLPPIRHFEPADLYRQIDAWQRSVDA